METEEEVKDQIEVIIDNAINFDLETYDRDCIDQIYDLLSQFKSSQPSDVESHIISCSAKIDLSKDEIEIFVNGNKVNINEYSYNQLLLKEKVSDEDIEKWAAAKVNEIDPDEYGYGDCLIQGAKAMRDGQIKPTIEGGKRECGCGAIKGNTSGRYKCARCGDEFIIK